jgi:hypothetical protein
MSEFTPLILQRFEPKYWQQPESLPVPALYRQRGMPPFDIGQKALRVYESHARDAMGQWRRSELEPVAEASELESLPQGTMVAYDIERLVGNDEYSKAYPQCVVKPGYPTQAAFRLTNRGPDFLTDHYTHAVRENGLWLPRAIAIARHNQGRKSMEYVRECGIGMLLKVHGDTVLRIPPTLAKAGNTDYHSWQPAGPMAAAGTGTAYSIRRRPFTQVIERLNELCAYAPSAVDLEPALQKRQRLARVWGKLFSPEASNSSTN